MSEKLSKDMPFDKQPSKIIKSLNEDRKKLQGFLITANQLPNSDETQKNTYANNALYLPISYIEMQLDELYFGLWQTKNFRWEIVVNEVIGSIELDVFHPVKNIWITRTGSAATPIQMKKGSDLGPNMSQYKIHNTLVKDFPHLKAEALKNAAKSLGKWFGRDLNRKFEDIYTPLLIMPENDPMTIGQASMLEGLIGGADRALITDTQLSEITNSVKSMTFNQASKIIDELWKVQKNVDDDGRRLQPGEIESKNVQGSINKDDFYEDKKKPKKDKK